MSRIKEAAAIKLTRAQRQVINNDDVDWVGWDAKDRPVVNAYYHAGLLQPREQSRRNKESKLRTWAIARNGDAVDVTEPVIRMF
jgi:hypothetical protein